MKKVSVIIPTYNMECFIRECLDSIISQTLKDIEIICIDDCSSDNTCNIINECIERDSRIKLFRKDINTGPGASRNIGIRNSVGDYIIFIDSDDYVSNNYLEELYNTAVKYDSDIVSTSSFYTFDSNGIYPIEGFTIELNKLSKKYYEGKSNISIENLGDRISFMSPMTPNKLYRRDFVVGNNLYFLETYCAEDWNFHYKALINHPKTSYNHKAVYYYRKNHRIIIGKIRNFENNMYSFNNLIEYFKKNNVNIYICINLVIDILIVSYLDVKIFYYKENDRPILYDKMHKFMNHIDWEINSINNETYKIKCMALRQFNRFEDYQFFSLF